MIFATSSKAFSSNPRVVAAGVPKRIPLRYKRFFLIERNGILLHVIPTESKVSSASLPVSPIDPLHQQLLSDYLYRQKQF